MTNIDDFQDNIGNEFNVFNDIPPTNKLLVNLYDRYKKCVASGGEDCLEIAIGTIREFFDNVRSNIDEELSDETIFELYEDYLEEMETLEYDEGNWGNYLSDLGKSELNRIQEDAAQDLAEDAVDKDEDFDEAVQIEAPETEEVEEVEEVEEEDPFDTEIGNISNNVNVPGSGDYSYGGNLFLSYDGSELLIDSYQLQKLYPELYTEMYDTQSGTTTHQIDTGLTYTPNYSLSGDDATNFLVAYYGYILNAYSTSGAIIVSEEGQQSILWSDDEDTQGILQLLYYYYENNMINELADLIDTEEYADIFLNAVQDLDANNGYTETENFYESMSYIIYTMENTYEDYSLADVYEYMKENNETFGNEDTITEESILAFYTDKGYTYNAEEDKLYTAEEYNELLEDEFVEQELDPFESTIGNISNNVNVPGSGDYSYQGGLFTSYDGTDLIIDSYQLSKLYPELYTEMYDTQSGTTTHQIDTGLTYTPNYSLSGDDATNFLMAYYYYILEEYSKTGAIIVSDTGEQSILWSEDETAQGALMLLWEYYTTDDPNMIFGLDDIISNADVANTILEYVVALDPDFSYTEQFYENMQYLVYETDAITNEINYSDIYAYMADNYDEMNQDDITQESISDYYIEEKGYTYDEENEVLLQEGEEKEIQGDKDGEEDEEDEEEEAEDTPKTDSLIDGYYYTQDADGTYRVYQVSNGQISGSDETYENDDFLRMFSGDKDVDFYELTPELLDQVEDFGDIDKETITNEMTDKYAADVEDTTEEVGGHIRDINNSLNPYQITENMGQIELNQRKPTTNFTQSLNKPNTLMGVKYDGSSRIEHIPNESETDFTTEGGNNLMRLDGSSRKLTREEWRIIEESYLYDKDISKPFIVDKLENPSQYKVNYNNVFEYYFELSNQNKNFFIWLDSYKGGEEGRSFINYKVSRNIQSSNVDIESYVKTGSILDLIPSVDFTPHFNNQGSQAQEKAIIETHALGIEDVNAFVLVASLCSLFSNLIMENAKHIGKNKVVQDIESGFTKGDYSKLQDSIYTGIYKEGSQIKNSIQNSNLSDAQKNVLNAIFEKRSFKSMADYEINNRYGEIVLKFFGTNDTRKHKLENNSGKVLFELGCIYLSYYACMMDNDELLGIDSNEKSNLIKISSEFLETLYPSQKYDQNLLTGIDNLMKLFTREIRNIKRGNVANEITAKDLLTEVIRDMVDISMNETPTTFNIYQFFDETIMGHISNNFGLDMHTKIGRFDDMIDFLADGFLDSQQFNQMVASVMASTMGERMKFKGNELLETLFMSDLQAQTFINNSKFNLLIPLIHPEIIDLVPPSKVNINLWGFNAKIVGLVKYDKKMPIYDTAIQDDINIKTTLLTEEPNFITEEDAEKRGDIMDIQGTHQHEDGTFMVGDSHEVLEKYYEDLAVNQDDFSNAMFNLTKTKEADLSKIATEEHRLMVEDEEDIQKLEDKYEMGDVSDDWKLAGLLEILNKNPQDIEKELKNVITDFTDVEVIKPTEGDNYVMLKHGDKLYVAFRGSKGFFEYQDWYGETGNFRNLDVGSFYSMGKLGLGQNHQGFRKGYEKMKDGLIDALNDNLDSNTQLYITGHSRGTAFADMLVEDAIKIHPKDKITYRGFGYITHRNKDSAEQMNKKIKGMDYMTYHISGDPLRLLTKVLPYHSVGENKIITGYESAFTGSLFYGADINSLAEVKEDDKGAMATAYEDFWRIARTPLASQHFITGYKNLLAQDNHVFKFRKKADSTFNTPSNLALGATMLYGGWKSYKLLSELRTTSEELDKSVSMAEQDLEEGVVYQWEMDEEIRKQASKYEDKIAHLSSVIVSTGNKQYIDEMKSTYVMNEPPFTTEFLQYDLNPPQPLENLQPLTSPRMPELDISPIKAVRDNDDIPPPMGKFDDGEFRRGGKVDDMTHVDTYEYGGKVEDYEEIEKYKEGGSVKSKMSCNNPKKSTRDGKRKMVKACEGGTEKLIHYGDSNLGAHPNDPKRKKSFRARHKCDTNPPDKLSARYWSCKDW